MLITAASLCAMRKQHADPVNADDMVRKAGGWWLQDATRRGWREVLRYLVANRDPTTRLILPYASRTLAPAGRARGLGRGRAAR